MKKLALVFIVVLRINTSFCMEEGDWRYRRPPLIVSFTTDVINDVTKDEDDSCCEYAVDCATSLGAGASAALVAQNLFNNGWVTALAFGFTSLAVFGIRTGEPEPVFNPKEKND